VSAVRQLTAHDIPPLRGIVQSEIVGGFTPNISDYAQFNWYEYVWIYDPTVQFPADARKLARWIGVAHDVGNPMTFWVLPQSCKVLARSSVSSLTDDELADPSVQARMAELDASIREKIGDSISNEEVDMALADLLPTIPDDLFLEEDTEYEPFEEDAAMPEADDYTPEAYDKYMTDEVKLANMGTLQKGTVMRRKRDADGNPVGRSHTNPRLDTREYEVEFQELLILSWQTSLLRACTRKSMKMATPIHKLARLSITSPMARLCARTTVWSDQRRPTTASTHDAGTEAPRLMEGRIDVMGAFERPKGILSSASCRVRRGQQDRRRTCFRLVVEACVTQA
jgi:hypothetical protein